MFTLRNFISYTCISLMLIACSRKSISTLTERGVTVTQHAVNIGTIREFHHVIQIQYNGCGGLTIREPGRAIMIDPFFSHQKFMAIGRSMLFGGKIKSKPPMIAFAKKRILDSLKISEATLQADMKAIFSAHGHYDHLMDIPFVHRNWFAQHPNVYVNESSFNTCANVISPQKLSNVEPLLSIRNQLGGSVDFPSSDGSVLRVYPILAAHNPHARNIKLFSGSVMKDLPQYNRPEAKTKINDWLEGRTLSFLIDIEKNNEVLFRMFVQSSSCHFPDGLPPEALLKNKSVDLAVMGVASYQFSEASYPCRYLDTLQPKKLMFIHWEDFFRSYKRKPKSLMKNNVPRFFKEVVSKCKPDEYILPSPGVVINVSY